MSREVTYYSPPLGGQLNNRGSYNFSSGAEPGSAQWMADYTKWIQQVGRLDAAQSMRNQAVTQDLNNRAAETKTGREVHNRM